MFLFKCCIAEQLTAVVLAEHASLKKANKLTQAVEHIVEGIEDSNSKVTVMFAQPLHLASGAHGYPHLYSRRWRYMQQVTWNKSSQLFHKYYAQWCSH